LIPCQEFRAESCRDAFISSRSNYWVKVGDCQSQREGKTAMIKVTVKAAEYIAARGGHLTLTSKILAG
jgi:hypothetical protein